MTRMSAVWDRSSEFLSEHLAAVVGIALPLLYLPTLAQTILGPLRTGTGPGTQLAIAIVLLVLTLVTVFGQLALVALILQGGADAGGVRRIAAARFGPTIGVSLVLLLLYTIAALPVVFIAAAGGVDFVQMASGSIPTLPPGIGVAILLYALVLIPVALWVGLRLLPLAAVIVAERRGLRAIPRAFAMTRGLGWRLFGMALLFAVIFGVATLAAQTVFGSILRLLLGAGPGITPASVATAVVTTIVSTLFTVVIITFATQLYLATRDRDAEADGALPTT